MSEYDDSIQINAQTVVPGDVLLTGEVVEEVKIVDAHFVAIKTDGGDHHPRLDTLVAVREVVCD